EILNEWRPQENAIPELIELLELNAENDFGIQLAYVLGEWGPTEKGSSALVELLKDKKAEVRLRAAKVLEIWGQQETALQSLLDLLEHTDPKVRIEAVEELTQSGMDTRALAALVALVKDPVVDAIVGSRATQLLWQLGPQEGAVPAVLELLKNPDSI